MPNAATAPATEPPDAPNSQKFQSSSRHPEPQTHPVNAMTYHAYAFNVQRLTPCRLLLRPLGSVEVILPGRASVAAQQHAARLIRRTPHDYPLGSLTARHPATKARRLTCAQARRYERACAPLPH